MAYIGSSASPLPVNFSAVQGQSFSGTGAQVAFTLNRSVASPIAIEVLVNNVQQSPYDGSFTVSGSTLTFSEAPSLGTNNIYVIYRDQSIGTLTDLTAYRKAEVDALLATKMPVNGPAFSAYFTGTQNVTSNTITKVTVNTEVFDTNSNYDHSTNYRFTPTVAGYYQVNFAVEGSASAGTCQAVNAVPYKNGAAINGLLYAYGAYLYATAVNGGSSTGTVLVYMNGSTDFLELYGKVIGTSPTIPNAYFSAFLARSAT